MSNDASITPEAAFRRRLKEARAARGMTQRDLAERLAAIGQPMTQAAVTRIERGERRVSLDEAIAIAAVLDVAPIHLFLPIEGDSAQLAPKLKVPIDRARAWARGQHPLDPSNAASTNSSPPHVGGRQVETGHARAFNPKRRTNERHGNSRRTRIRVGRNRSAPAIHRTGTAVVPGEHRSAQRGARHERHRTSTHQGGLMKGHVRKRGKKWAVVVDIGRAPKTR